MANLSNINGKFVVEQTTGYVGVGTTDPNYPIEVLNASAEIALNASGASIYRLKSDSTDSFRINKNGVGDRLVIAGNGNATFAGEVNATRFILPSTGTTTPANQYLFSNNTNTGTGSLIVQSGGGSAGYGGGIRLFSHSHASKPGWVTAGISSGSGGKFTVNTSGIATGTDVFTVDTSGNATFSGNVGIGTDSPGTFLQLGSYPVSGTYVNNATYPDVPSEHMIHLTAPSTTGYFGGGISFGENAFTAANITAVDAGGGGALHLAFGTGNSSGMTERVRIANNGNVGIGTATPGYKLNVINDNTATWTARFTNNTNNVYLSVNDANNYGIYVSGETKNYFSGNVGIGTTNPNAKLHVNGSVHFGTDSAVINPTSGQLLLETTAGNSTSLLMYTYGASIFQIQSQGTTAQIGWGSSQPRTVNFTNSGAGSIAVGIGTTSPTSTLSVQGTTNNGINVIGVGTTATRVYAGLNSSNHGYLFATGSSGQSPSLINSAGGDSYISGGNVGIGITSPQDKLHVNGDAIISSTKFGDFAVASINTTGYAIATISATTNGQSAIVEFVASGNNGGYYNVVYSCYNGGGVWYYTKNVVGSGGNIEVAETNGAGSSTLVFYFRATSNVASYTPRVMMKGMPYNLVTF